MHLKSMTLDQYNEVVEFIQKHYGFHNKVLSKSQKADLTDKYPNILKNKLRIKYIESSYDSRTKDVWLIKLIGFGSFVFSSNSFSHLSEKETKDFPYHTLFDWVMGFLKGDWMDVKHLEMIKVK